MGFAHLKSGHHFLLFREGGAIQLVAQDPKDVDTVDAMRSHLQAMQRAFSAGDFSMPVHIHNTTIPGLGEMKRARSKIAYAYFPTPDGGVLRMRSRYRRAVRALHAFLRFQIKDHRTGDPGVIQRRPELPR